MNIDSIVWVKIFPTFSNLSELMLMEEVSHHVVQETIDTSWLMFLWRVDVTHIKLFDFFQKYLIGNVFKFGSNVKFINLTVRLKFCSIKSSSWNHVLPDQLLYRYSIGHQNCSEFFTIIKWYVWQSLNWEDVDIGVWFEINFEEIGS